MDKRFLIRVAITIAVCVPPPEGPGSWLRQEAKGQAQALVLGHQWTHLGVAGTTLSLRSLPQPGGVGEALNPQGPKRT